MNVTRAIKVSLTNVVWFVPKLWIDLFPLWKNFTLNTQMAGSNFQNFKWFSYLKLCGAFYNVEHIITNQIF